MKTRYLILYSFAIIFHYLACICEWITLFVLLYLNYDFILVEYVKGAAIVISAMAIDYLVSFFVRRFYPASARTLHIFDCLDLTGLALGLPVTAGLIIIPIQSVFYGFDSIGAYVLVYILESMIVASRVVLYVCDAVHESITDSKTTISKTAKRIND